MGSTFLAFVILGSLTLYTFCVVMFSKSPKKQNQFDVLELDKSTTNLSDYTSCLNKDCYIGWE